MLSWLDQPRHFRNVVVDDEVPRDAQRVAGASGRDVRIAIAISANPRAEMQKLGKPRFPGLGAVKIGQRLFQFRVQARHGFKQHHREIVETHVNLVAHRRLLEADLIGLPQGRDFLQNFRFVFQRVRLRQKNVVEPLEQPRDAPPLQPDGMSRNFGGMRREYRRDADFL